MKVTDLNGCEIEITNLKEAIKIAKRNTGYSHEDKSFLSSTKDKKPIGRTYMRNLQQSKTNR